ncbi:hypothetical protein ACFQI7_28100 [Paenibacillus allorhizosphaerae]|uniref:Uncharacterized protein n=1 Tax=Paenibacillus allorhizosphaerae TaxID=2849866 RepID=A0ABM8VNJ5_9BACL|nr:hypothetical protein [Paenibacillus allorhizosphaerae]CAG7651543.1 hypothetical protein PAECIP111802_04990 [Paenibacillus allorhizosphaerae]
MSNWVQYLTNPYELFAIVVLLVVTGCLLYWGIKTITNKDTPPTEGKKSRTIRRVK